MFDIKICLMMSVNFLFYLTTTIATNNNNNYVDIVLEKKNNDCCLDTVKRAINDKSMGNIMTVADGVNSNTDELSKNIKDRSTVERNANPSVVPRKGVSSKSISARKGVDNSITTTEVPEKNNYSSTENEKQFNDNKNTMEKFISVNNTTQINSIKNSTDINSTTISTIKHLNTTKKKFRPKPTATIGGINNDNSKPIVHGAPTKSPPLGMSTKINYVVPVIITILILPLFVLSMIYIYKNGRDCWEKRHYRRMDFLIDGMYNE
ncbi:hypothetical protein PV327_010740 [Microctonus hyperodae]|uniref:Uncharacterized protein n=1 Tax=Microctonus hyperodae TaxID=165561 RepID=A0AA39F0D2_MICHY|nr:hypothetical protein PV327_010740 [Microctonus hyperodae]